MYIHPQEGQSLHAASRCRGGCKGLGGRIENVWSYTGAFREVSTKILPFPMLNYKGHIDFTTKVFACQPPHDGFFYSEQRMLLYHLSRYPEKRKWPLVWDLGTAQTPANVSATDLNRTTCVWKYAQKVFLSVTGYVIIAVNNSEEK